MEKQKSEFLNELIEKAQNLTIEDYNNFYNESLVFEEVCLNSLKDIASFPNTYSYRNNGVTEYIISSSNKSSLQKFVEENGRTVINKDNFDFSKPTDNTFNSDDSTGLAA